MGEIGGIRRTQKTCNYLGKKRISEDVQYKTLGKIDQDIKKQGRGKRKKDKNFKVNQYWKG